MQVVAVAGQYACGKDLLCDYLVEKLNVLSPHWERAAFANAVKDVFCQSFGVTRQFIEDWKRNPEPPTGFLKNIRQSLQYVGDGFRQIQEDIWIDIALRDESKKLVISDSRYLSEARTVKKKGGAMIVMYRPGFMNDDPNPSEAQIKPIMMWCADTQKDGLIVINSEQDAPKGIEDYDLFIRNDGTTEELYKKVDDIIVPYLKQKYGN